LTGDFVGEDLAELLGGKSGGGERMVREVEATGAKSSGEGERNSGLGRTRGVLNWLQRRKS